MNVSSTITHLLACIDAGDRDALYPLADAMLEAGDPRAAGVLWLIEQRKWPLAVQEGAFQWYDHKHFGGVWDDSNLPHDVFQALENWKPGDIRFAITETHRIESQYGWTTYETASAAILDAAAVKAGAK